MDSRRNQLAILQSRALNFRSNIFGFPNAAGLDEQNLGLLDQRLALEWIRDNIGKLPLPILWTAL
jgi:carboxylesterase type B